MAQYVFNISKGRISEFAYRVKNGDPAASRLYLCVLTTDPAQATAIDVDDFGALITAGAVESVANRKVLAAADITTVAPDDSTDKYWVDVGDQTWTAVGAGAAWVALILGYAAVATPTNAQIIPMSHHDFAVTPDGSDIVAQIAATGIVSAT